MRRTTAHFCAFAAAALAATPLLQDLTAVIALHGQPCGQVVSAVQQSGSDYVASCTDGTRYRVYTNDKGRVIVEKQ